MKNRSFRLAARLLAVVMVGVLLFAGMAGCAESEPEITEWNYPVITVLTGPAAAYGLDRDWTAKYVAGQINEDGGVNGIPIKVTSYDATTLDATKAVTVMTEALATDPLCILGPFGSNATGASAYLPAEEGVPFIATFNNEEEQAQYAPWGLAFQVTGEKALRAAIKEWLRLNSDIETVVILYTPEMFPNEAAWAEDECAKSGAETLEIVEVSPPGALDLGPVATRVMALEADGYYCILSGEDYARFCKAMFERGMTEGRRILTSNVALGAGLFEIGQGYLEDTYVYEVIDLFSPDPDWVAYVDTYGAEHGGNFPYTAATYGTGEDVLALTFAIEELGLTGDPAKLTEEREAIRDFLWNCTGIPDMQGGTWSYVNGAKYKDLYLYQIKDNALTFVSKVPTE